VQESHTTHGRVRGILLQLRGCQYWEILLSLGDIQGGCAPPAPPASSSLPSASCACNLIIAICWIGIERYMKQHRASPAGKHIHHHRSPQQIGTMAEQVPHAITNHMTTVQLAAVLGPPQHRRMHLLQCLQLCCGLLNCARPPPVVHGPHQSKAAKGFRR
jgi:hypothetical protein